MSQNMIIVFCGKKGAGKDTAGAYLAKYYGFRTDAFAAPLKEAARILFGFDDAQLYGDQKESLDLRWNTTPREIMQFMGTEMFRLKLQELLPYIGENFWVASFVKRIKANHDYVITDCRFSNEITYLTEHAAQKVVVITIERDTKLNKFSQHSSENNEIDAHHTIDNNGPITTMYSRIDNIMFRYDRPKITDSSDDTIFNLCLISAIIVSSLFIVMIAQMLK